MANSDSDEPGVRAEPVPNWETATESWDWAWELHTYGIGVGFSLLGIYCVYTSVLLLKYNNGKLRPFYITINMLVLLLCLMRAVFLFIDPYRSKEIFSELVAQTLFNLSFPCLTSGYSLVNWAFLESSKFKLLSPKLQNVRILIAIIIVHFAFVLTVDFVVAYVTEGWILVMLCQGTFVVWGLILCMGFSYSAWKVYHIKSKARKNMYGVNKKGISGRFRFRKSNNKDKRRNENNDYGGNMSPGVTTNLGIISKRFSLTGTNGTIPETYDALKDDSPSVSPVHQSPALNYFDDNDVIVKTDLKPNNIVDANGTLYTVNARHDLEPSHENDAFGVDDENDSQTTRPTCDQSIEIDQTNSKTSSNENVYKNTISKHASSFIMSVKGNNLLKKKRYFIRSVKRLSVSKKTSVTTKMMRITIVTTMFAAIICLVNTYAMFGVFSVLATEKELEPWGWYAFQTVMRLCELGMGVTMAYLTTTTPPKTTKKNTPM